MRFAFNDDQLEFQKSLQNCLKRQCTAELIRKAWEGDNAPANNLWKDLQEMGILNAPGHEAMDGMDMSELDMILLFEESGRYALPGPFVEHSAVALPLLKSLSDQALATQWMKRMADEAAIVSVCFEGELVHGADYADAFVLSNEGEIHLVEKSAITFTSEKSVDASRRLARIEWDTSPATKIAEGEVALSLIREAQSRGALAASAQLLGLAHHMLHMTVEYVQIRKQFGKAIGTFQTIKHHLANSLIKIQFARPLVYRAAYSMAEGLPEKEWHVSMAKIYAADAADHAIRSALQCHGAMGYSYEYDLHLWMKRAWALSRAWGSVDHHRSIVAKCVLDDNEGE